MISNGVTLEVAPSYGKCAAVHCLVITVQMDLLTHILGAARARSPLIADLHIGSDVSLGLPHLPAIPFHYVLEGDCRIRLGQQSTSLQAGDFVLLPRWPDYRLETGTGLQRVEITDIAQSQNVPADYLRNGVGRPLRSLIGEGSRAARVLSGIVLPRGNNGGPLLRDLPDITLVRNTRTRLEPWLIAAVDFMSIEDSTPSPGFGAVAERLVELIFVASLRDWMLQPERYSMGERRLSDPSISRALDALHADPARHWSLRDLAAASGRSRSGFAERFHIVMGETPFAYLARWRMLLASDLVTEGRLSTADVGVSLGYRSLHGFARAFSDAFGETPSQHRRRGRRPPAD